MDPESSRVSKYRIQTVAQITGLSPALIRAWEARYGLVSPARTASGYRLYSDEDVAVLQGAQRLVKGGMAPMEVARLPRRELLDLGDSATGGPEREAGAGVLAAVPRGLPGLPGLGGRVVEHQPPPPQSFNERIDQLIDAFAHFDTQRAEQLLAQPLAVLSPTAVCRDLLLPLLRLVGDRWHRGELSVAAEHFGSRLIKGKLKALLEAVRGPFAQHRVVCACPAGEHHDLGLLMFALAAAEQQWEPIYLGADLPIFDLGEVVVKTRPELVALSVVQRLDAGDLSRLLHAVREAVGPRQRVLIGGGGVTGLTDVVRAAGCVLLPESGRLDELLGP